jgi:D-threonate/D-erythronate kinase
MPRPVTSPPERPVLRLLGDDLTGALDSAARFVPLVGPVPVIWDGPAISGTLAIDSGTRDLDPNAAEAAIARWTDALQGGDIAFKKIDSVLRGHVAAELAACRAGFDRLVIAPAFPAQGRITQGGRQWANGQDLGAPIPMLDAATDDDLDAIVAHHRDLPGRVLWVGTGGLAGALAGRRPIPCPALPRPIAALIGSDHPVTVSQCRAAASHPCIVTADLPAGTPRDAALTAIIAHFRAHLAAPPRPGTLFVTGGATLRALCEALGATGLTVDGEVEPGIPTAILRGGAWDGQRIVSKSGGFGDTGLLARLLDR